MDEAVGTALASYLCNPSDEAFEALRRAYLASPAYEPYSSAASDVLQLVNEDKFQEALDRLQAMMPGCFLSPRPHMLAAFLHRKLGHEEDERAEAALAITLLRAIARTGDGSQERPYRVTQTSDEYDLLEHHLGKTPARQTLFESDEGCFDLIACSDGTECWFEVTALMAVFAARLQAGSSGAEQRHPADNTPPET